MSARQYIPFSFKYKSIPLIIYPVKDENPLQDIYSNQLDIEEHLRKLYEKHGSILRKGAYHVLFVWSLEGSRMTGVWIHSMENWSDSGPLLECVAFRDLEVCHDAGIASGDSVICLGREEELRRTVDSLEGYVDREKYQPKFPSGLQPDEHF